MPTPQQDDDQDFVPVKKPEKGSRAAKSPAETPKPHVEIPEETTSEPAKSRFPSRMIREAEEYGFTPEEIEEFASVADFSVSLKHERERQSELRAAKLGRTGSGREGSPASEVPTSPAPATPAVAETAPEDAWSFEEDLSWAEESLRKELARLGKAALKASKGAASKEELLAMQKKLDEAHSTIQAMQAANNPVVKRANAVVAQYPSLFGKVFDDQGRPPEGTDEADRFDNLVTKINKVLASGKGTGVPEKDIPAAIASLWPGAKAGAAEAETELPVTPPSKQITRQVVKPPEKNGVTNRIAEWNDSAQAAPTGRNGADKTGIPSDGDAKKVIGKHLKKMGAPTEGATEDDDLEDF